MSRCAECGFDWEAPDRGLAVDIARLRSGYRRSVSDAAGRLLPAATLRERPTEDVWSRLEYLAHMRDVTEFYQHRVVRVLTEDRPVMPVGLRFAEVAEIKSYRSEDPAGVLDSFEQRIDGVCRRLAGVEHHEWARIGIGKGGERTLSVLAHRLAHEVCHHLQDIRLIVAKTRNRPCCD